MRIRPLLALATALAGVLLTGSATGADDTVAAPPGWLPAGAQPFEGGWAVPVSTVGPAWYDLDYHRQVLAAGDAGARLPAGVSAPAAAGLVEPGIRPGTWLITVTTNPVGFAWCTANFVFVKNGTYAIGTAGHCGAKDALGAYPDVTAYVVPPPGQGLPGIYHIGRFVLVDNRGVGEDFALVQIYPRYQSWVNPTMMVWGGPQGAYTSNLPTVVEHTGHGAVIGTGGTPRAGVAPIWTAVNGHAFAWYGASTPGDSGSGVLATLQGTTLRPAAGNLTHIVIFDPSLQILPGMVAGTRMTHILQIASGWTLVNGGLLGVP